MEFHRLRVLLGSFSVDSDVEEWRETDDESEAHGFRFSVEVRGVVAVDVDMADERGLLLGFGFVRPGSVCVLKWSGVEGEQSNLYSVCRNAFVECDRRQA
jgi:hypothetical protein